jgi:hypothetical protein
MFPPSLSVYKSNALFSNNKQQQERSIQEGGGKKHGSGASLPLFQALEREYSPAMTSENQKRKRRARSAAAKKLKKQRCQANDAIPQMTVATMSRLQTQQPMLIAAYECCLNKLQAERLHRILAAKARDAGSAASCILAAPTNDNNNKMSIIHPYNVNI